MITSAPALIVSETMARALARFACTGCGHEAPKWMGRCPGCGEWNTLQEEPAAGGGDDGVSWRDGRGGRRAKAKPRKPVPLGEVEALGAERLQTGSGELDRVLGGGVVPGSIVLMGGSPGIGKSTLMSAALGRVQESGRSALYVSGEESAAQIRLRAERLGAGALAVPVLAETSLETVRRDDRGRASRRVRDRLRANAPLRGSDRRAPAASDRYGRSPRGSSGSPVSSAPP